MAINLSNKTIEAVSHLLEYNTDFQVQVTHEQLTAILNRFTPYNRIPRNIAQIVYYVCDRIGPVKYRDENPNNGGFHNIKFYIGNEGSLAIYVKVSSSYRPDDNPENYVSILETIGNSFRADENKVMLKKNEWNENYTVTAKFWWD